MKEMSREFLPNPERKRPGSTVVEERDHGPKRASGQSAGHEEQTEDSYSPGVGEQKSGRKRTKIRRPNFRIAAFCKSNNNNCNMAQSNSKAS